MTKRYVFWRTPEGRAHAVDDGKHAPHALLSLIGIRAKLDNGNPNWQYAVTQYFETVIRSALIIIGPDKYELSETDSWAIAWLAVGDVVRTNGGGRPITYAQFQKAADKRAADWFRRIPTKYVLVTAISIPRFPASRIQVNDHVISPLIRRGKRYPYPEHISQSAFGLWTRSKTFTPLRITTNGRSPSESADKAIAALDLLRGIWTLLGTYQVWSFQFGPQRPRPLGVIHSGPLHTLHLPSGELATHQFWYEPDFNDEKPPYIPLQGWNTLEAERKAALRKMRSWEYRQDLEQLIRRYVAALDRTNLDVSFLHLWSILEKVTDTVGARYDETIRRTTWGHFDRELAKQALEGVRNRRNQFVHAAKSADARDQLVYLLKSFVEPHLFRLVRNDFGVKSIKEYSAYLELSSNPSELEKQKKLLANALRILKNRGP